MAWWELTAFWAVVALLCTALAASLLARARQAAAGPLSPVIIVAALGAPLLAIAIYLAIGKPGAPDTAFESRYQSLIAAGPGALERLSDTELVVLLERRAKDDPADPTPHIILAQVMLRAERYPDAVRALQSAVRRDPKSADAWILLGQTLMLVNGGPSRPAVDALKQGQAALPAGDRRERVGRMIAALEGALSAAQPTGGSAEAP